MNDRTLIEQLLRELGVAYRWLDHVAVFTVAESVKVMGDKVPIKNLLLQETGGDRKFLAIMAGNQRLDLKTLEKELNVKKLRFASQETLMQTLGVTPGAVSIFGLLHPGSKEVVVILDGKLIAENTEVGFHPNENTASIFFTADNIVPLLKRLDRKYLVTDLY